MTKTDFIEELRRRLSGLPHGDVEERLNFYAELIDDISAEEGITEDEAICRIGTVEDIAQEILADIPLTKIVREKTRSARRTKAWEVVLLVLGSPVWLPLFIAAFAVALSLYAVLWAVVISFWAVFVSFAVGGTVGGVMGGIVFMCVADTMSGLATIGAGLVLTGLSVFTFYGCKAVTKGTVILTKKLILWIKNLFIKRGTDNE